MEEEPKGPDWVLEQLNGIADAMSPTETCVSCKDCPPKEFDNCIRSMGIALSDVTTVVYRLVEHINLLTDTVKDIIKTLPASKRERIGNGIDRLYM